MTLALYSETNVVNSLSVHLAGQLLAAGYVVYWHQRDALQVNTTSSGWYYNYSTQFAAYWTNGAFQTLLQNAKGLVTLTDSIPAQPRFLQRPINDGSVPEADAVMAPTIAIKVGPAVDLGDYELGTRTKWRTRHLVLDAFVRTSHESGLFKDWFSQWFDRDTVLDIVNHDAGTLAAVGPVRFNVVRVDSDEVFDQAEARSFEVLLNARLDYVA